jgi:hypothetical protein
MTVEKDGYLRSRWNFKFFVGGMEIDSIFHLELMKICLLLHKSKHSLFYLNGNKINQCYRIFKWIKMKTNAYS